MVAHTYMITALERWGGWIGIKVAFQLVPCDMNTGKRERQPLILGDAETIRMKNTKTQKEIVFVNV